MKTAVFYSVRASVMRNLNPWSVGFGACFGRYWSVSAHIGPMVLCVGRA